MIAQDHTSEVDPEMLVTRLRRQLGLYHRLKRLSQRQRDLITSDHPQQLLVLLAERQKLVDELTSLNQSLVPFQEYWRKNHESVTPSLRRQADQLLKEAAEALQSILKIDDEDARILAARKAQAAEQVASLAVSRQAFRAYGADANQNKRQLIRTDESA